MSHAGQFWLRLLCKSRNELRKLTCAELAKLHRTFGRRDRHIGVGDFSAQCLTDAAKRGYSACAALRFFRPSARGVPARRKRDQRPDRMIVVGTFGRIILGSPADRCGGRRNYRQTKIGTLQIHDRRPAQSVAKKKSALKISPDALFGNGASTLKSRMHLRKDGQAFQPALSVDK